MELLINILVTVMLIEMMLAIGMRVPWSELLGTVKNWRLLLLAILANYVCVPAAAIALLLLFRAEPMVAAGFLILAVCPGAPFGPSCVGLAKGNVVASVGMMAVLAGSSAIVAPVLLQFLLPLMAGSDSAEGDKASLQIDTAKIVLTLFVTQLLPLCAGLAIRYWRPALATMLQKPAERLSAVLSLLTIGVILYVHFDLLLAISPRAYVGMTALLISSCVAGWLLGLSGVANRKAMAVTTALRNVGVGLVIATANFANTPAVTATVAYGLFEILGTLLLALWWSRGSLPDR